MNSRTKTIAKVVFGRVEGLPYNLKNLKYVVSNEGQFKIIDRSIYNGFAFITQEKGIINCSKAKNEVWHDFNFTVQEFWAATRERKSQIMLLKNIAQNDL